jgi:hypothetical protein
MRLLIVTQYRENYAFDAAGNPMTGELAFWKNKGGEEILVDGFQYKSNEETEELIASLPNITWKNEASESYVIGWEVVENDFQTEDEKLQLKYDGKITYPTTVLRLAA